MAGEEVYRELSKKLGTEQSQIVPRIWAMVCSMEEAEMINSLPATANDLAQRFNKTLEEIDNILQSLFHRGVVFEAVKQDKTTYRMPRHIVQFHDASSLWKEAPQELLDLWKQYSEEEYPRIPALLTAIKASPFFRVVPVNEKIETRSQVLAYEDAAKIVDAAFIMAVTNCPCRMIMHKCDKPVEVCLQLNKGAEYAIKRGTGRQVKADEAKTILRMSEEAGLVHLTENKASVGTVICNCCRCCCIGLPYAKKAETSGMLVPSRYQAVIDEDACTACGICPDECPMDAITMNDANVAQVNGEACIGCGVCTNVCPMDAIHLKVVRGEDFIPQ